MDGVSTSASLGAVGLVVSTMFCFVRICTKDWLSLYYTKDRNTCNKIGHVLYLWY